MSVLVPLVWLWSCIAASVVGVSVGSIGKERVRLNILILRLFRLRSQDTGFIILRHLWQYS